MLLTEEKLSLWFFYVFKVKTEILESGTTEVWDDSFVS